MPHNLFLNTTKLWARAGADAKDAGPPRRVFTFDSDVPTSAKRISGVTLTFSYANTAAWQWMPARGAWQRLLDGSPMTLESDQPITAENVVIQQVVVSASNLVDVLGNPSPEITLTGTGKVWVLRDGRLIAGRWVRPVMGAVTKLEMRDGTIIALSPGNTWVELLPKGTVPDFHR